MIQKSIALSASVQSRTNYKANSLVKSFENLSYVIFVRNEGLVNIRYYIIIRTDKRTGERA